MRIIYSPTFQKQYRKLAREIKDIAEEREGIFRVNPFDSRLKTHKLHGRLSGLWAFSITGKIRIIFEFGKRQSVVFHTVGPHDIYD